MSTKDRTWGDPCVDQPRAKLKCVTKPLCWVRGRGRGGGPGFPDKDLSGRERDLDDDDTRLGQLE